MIKFFRQIRFKLMEQNKTSKYFKYAIGEIILVVIGILIALQINNWNENSKEQKKITSYVKNLALDIKEDISQTEQRIKSIKIKVIYIDSIADYFRNKNIEDIDNLEALYMMYDNYGYKPFTWYKSTIEEIKSSGSLKLIKNDSLHELINKYYALTDHLNQDYLEDFEISESLNRDMAKIINTNYENRKSLIDTLFLSFRKRDKSIYYNSEVYKKAKALNYPILTHDINQIHAFVNSLFRYKVSLRIRYENEFPKLINRGEKIIKMIEEEYYD